MVQPPELGGVVELPEVGGLIINTSGEQHSHSVTVLFGRSLTLHLAVASLKKIWQANEPICRSVEKITSADFILEIEPKRTSSGKHFTTAKFWQTTGSYLKLGLLRHIVLRR
jgi:hypothetical protein